MEQPMMPFAGFTPETGQFFWDLAFHNERPWFQAHKEEFTRLVQTPFRALAVQTAQALGRLCPEAALELHVARIYRDARRLFGRGPYKDHLWFDLHEPLREEGPTLWFSLSGAGFRCGMGHYASPAGMERFRARVLADPAPMTELARRLAEQDRFRLEAEQYKRPKGELGPLLDPWFNSRHLAILRGGDYTAELADPALPERLAEDFAWLMPYFAYFRAL